MRSTPLEFNTVLALRAYDEFLKGNRKLEERLPEKLIVGERYQFDKAGYRVISIEHPIPLFLTRGDGDLDRWPLASVVIGKSCHYLDDSKKVRTEGIYEIYSLFREDDPDSVRDFLESLMF